MERVPRELFVPRAAAARARTTTPRCRSATGQTISQPYMVARICEALELDGGERVLDVGTGSGYQAAVLAELAAEVAHDRADPRARRARRGRALAQAGLRAASRCTSATGRSALPERAPFDAIAVAAAAPEVPPTLYEQLEPGGRLVVPVGGAGGQELQVVVRSPRARPCSARCRAASSRSSAQEGFVTRLRRPRRAGPVRRSGTLGRWRDRRQRASRPRVRGRALRRPQNWIELAQVLGRRRERLRRQPRRLRRAAEGRRPPLPAGRRLLVRRRGLEQLPLEPALDVPPPPRPRLLPGPALPRRLARRARVEPRDPAAGLVALGVGKIVAQAIAIVLVTPFSFIANKLWSFRRRLSREPRQRRRRRRCSCCSSAALRPRAPPRRPRLRRAGPARRGAVRARRAAPEPDRGAGDRALPGRRRRSTHWLGRYPAETLVTRGDATTRSTATGR